MPYAVRVKRRKSNSIIAVGEWWKMRLKYLFGAMLSEAYRFARVFPNSDPIMGFILPAAKNEPVWKGPLFAFATMFVFDFFTSGIGVWTWVTSSTYAIVALAFSLLLRGKKINLQGYMGAGAIGVLSFDFITGPIMSSALFGQSFVLTLIMQVPFTIMHLVSATFSILIISPLLDRELMAEMRAYIHAAKNAFLQWRVWI